MIREFQSSLDIKEQRCAFRVGETKARPLVYLDHIYKTATKTAGDPNANLSDLIVEGIGDALKAGVVTVIGAPSAVYHIATGQQAHLENVTVSDGALPHSQQLVSNVTRQLRDGEIIGATVTALAETLDAPFYDAFDIKQKIVVD